MTFERPAEDAARVVREFVQGRLVELASEINRTDNVAFRAELQKNRARTGACEVQKLGHAARTYS